LAFIWPRITDYVVQLETYANVIRITRKSGIRFGVQRSQVKVTRSTYWYLCVLSEPQNPLYWRSPSFLVSRLSLSLPFSVRPLHLSYCPCSLTPSRTHLFTYLFGTFVSLKALSGLQRQTFKRIFTDHVSRVGIAISIVRESVRLSLRLFPLHLLNRLTFELESFECVWIVIIARLIYESQRHR